MMQAATCWPSHPVARSTDDLHRQHWHYRNHCHWDCSLHQVLSASVPNHYCCLTHCPHWTDAEGPVAAYRVVGLGVYRPIQTLPASVPKWSEMVGCYIAAVDRMTYAGAVAPARAILSASGGSWSAACGSYRCYPTLIWHCLARFANPDAGYPVRMSANLSTRRHRSDPVSEIERN